MSTIVSGYSNNKTDMLLKGAPDRILAKCTHYMGLQGKSVEMSDRDRRAFIKEINDIASKGLRCLALAEIPNSGKLSNITVENKQDLLSDITKFNEFE